MRIANSNTLNYNFKNFIIFFMLNIKNIYKIIKNKTFTYMKIS